MGVLQGKVALVTGGNGGIGRAIALAFAAEGAKVAVGARNEAKNEAVATELAEAAPDCLVRQADVRSEEEVRALVQAAADRWGRIDILVNNAGVAEVALAAATTYESWQRVLDTNLTSAFLCSKHVAPVMIADGRGGKIINLASMYSIFGGFGLAGYAASKGGVVALTKTLAVELAPHNIQVNALAPGWILTDMTRGIQGTDFEKQILDRTPAARWGTDEDVKGPAVFLASDASNFVTGVVLPVDGGFAVR